MTKVEVKDWITRDSRRQMKLAAGIRPRTKERPCEGTEFVRKEAEQAYEIHRLQMENKLLRDFLRSAGRK